MGKLLVILGSTATGKTDLALSLAKKFNGELVSCDSRQVYKGLDIGTGKYPSAKGTPRLRMGQEVKREKGYWEIDRVRIWMYDVVSAKKQYTVADYVKNADSAVSDIMRRNRLPIVVGGTGLYMKVLLHGLPNLSIPVDQKLRKSLEALSKEELQKKLQILSRTRWDEMNQSDRENPRRLIRAIELAKALDIFSPAGPIMSEGDEAGITYPSTLNIGLIAKREVLYKLADERVIDRINQGMVEEAKKLYANGLSLKRMRQLGLEYGVLADFFEGRIKNRDELIKIMQRKIHDFIRRQVTWFKKERDVSWFDVTENGYIKKIEKMVGFWYDNLTNAAKN